MKPKKYSCAGNRSHKRLMILAAYAFANGWKDTMAFCDILYPPLER